MMTGLTRWCLLMGRNVTCPLLATIYDLAEV